MTLPNEKLPRGTERRRPNTDRRAQLAMPSRRAATIGDYQRQQGLRIAAEAQLDIAPVVELAVRSPQETLHDLQVHQVELEMQNEALRQAKQALEESRDRYADLYEFAPAGYFTLSTEGSVIEVNLTGSALLGRDRKAVLHRSFSAFVTGRSQAAWGREFLALISEGNACTTELSMTRADGTTFSALVNAESIVGWRPGVLNGSRVRITLTDISQTRRKNDLLPAGILQSAILNSAQFSSVATDSDGVIQIFNVGAERMMGYTESDVVGRITPYDLCDPKELSDRAAALSAEFGMPIAAGFEAFAFKATRGMEDIFELTCIRKDGRRFPVVVSVIALRDDDNAIIGFLLIYSDNTARQRSKQALVESERRLNFALRMSHTGGWDIDLVDHASDRTVDIGRIFGTEAEAEKWDYDVFLSYVLPEDRAVVDRSFRKAMAAQTGWDFECRIQRADGELRWIWATGEHQADADGNMQRMAGIVQDITNRKQGEAERAQLTQSLMERNAELEVAKVEAEQANRAKSEFLSNMSHELRTPLGAILGFAQLMELGATDPGQKQSIDQILKSGWYLLTLINEILDLAVIESGKIALEMDSVSLKEVLLECESMIAPQSRKRNIRVRFDLDAEPLWVHADCTRIKQVIINLLSNAIKYNRPNGDVTLNCTHSAAGTVRITVRDSGEGLAEAQIAQLFQTFNRLGRKSSVVEGTGIGLVVSKRLVELMGGVIGVDSVVGVGSEFWIELKELSQARGVAKVNERAAYTPAPKVADASAHRLLYVEDNPASMLLMQELMACRTDICLITAKDGDHGIVLARSSLPDVILMDINLPGASGVDALRALKQDPATAHIPVIAVSANALPADIQIGMGAGFFRYLTKPLRINKLMDTVDLALAASTLSKGTTVP
jgi:PAS domain S-box-containing protein